MSLPYMTDKRMMQPVVQTRFGGLNNNLSAADGEIVWMENMSSREYPLMRPRKPRGLAETLTEPYALGAHENVLFWVDGTGFYYGGQLKGAVTKSRKQFAVMGSMILIWPDKKYYDFKAGAFGNLEQSVSKSGVQFKNGAYAEVPAAANTIYKAEANWNIRAGDAVTISGCVIHPENNLSNIIVREVDGDYLRFYENTFTLDSTIRYTVGYEGLAAGTYHFEEGGQFTLTSDLSRGDTLTWNGTSIDAVIGGVSSTITVTEGEDGDLLVFSDIPTDYIETGTITLSRQVPDLDYICVNENRLWGCKGDTIYASALGDPYNFNVFDGLSTDSWASDTTDAGDFTACVSYQGYPIFFKEDSVFKVQGDSAQNFAWTRTSRFGVRSGSAASLAIAGETLFYLSRVGVCAYQGGMPTVISGPLGTNIKWGDSVGGSDGLQYYVRLYDDETGESHLFVFDTRYGEWFREDDIQPIGFAFADYALLMLDVNGNIWDLEGWSETTDAPVEWQVKFADSYRFYETTDSGSQNKKGPLRILIRAMLPKNSSVVVKMKYDDGTTHTVGTLTGSAGEKKKTYIIPLILRRCDHYRLSLDGVGDAVIYSIAIEKYSGAQFQGSSVTLPNADSM